MFARMKRTDASSQSPVWMKYIAATAISPRARKMPSSLFFLRGVVGEGPQDRRDDGDQDHADRRRDRQRPRRGLGGEPAKATFE